MNLTDRALADTEGENQAMRNTSIPPHVERALDEGRAVPQRVAALGGPEEYQVRMTERLGQAVEAGDWNTVRQIATDPHVDDVTIGAAIGAMDDAGVTHTQARHGVPESAVHPEGRIIGRNAEAAPAGPAVTYVPVGTLEQGTPLHLTLKQHQVLLRPVNPNRVQDLRGNSHMEAWDIRRYLNRIFGFGGWDLETIELACVREIEHPAKPFPNGDPGKPRWTVVYRCQARLTIKNPDGSIGAVYEDGAAGDSANQPALGDAHDQAMKTALSQALKRCATNLGDQFGLSLYNHGSRDAQVVWTLAGPTEAGAPSPEAVTANTPVQAEEQPTPVANLAEEQAPAPEEPPAREEGNAVQELPNAELLGQEALLPRTPLDRLRQIMAMVHPQKGDHPAHGHALVHNENGEQEKLAALVYRQIQARKQEGEQG